MTDLSTLTILATISASACYALAIVQLLIVTRSNANQQQTQAFPLWGLAGAVLHLLTIALNTIEHQGLSSSLFDALSITAFIIMSMGLIAQTRYTLRAMLLPAFIIAIICLVLANR